MFKDIGKKIKVVAKVYTWIGIIGGAICGIVLLAFKIIIPGIIVLIVAPIISWLSMFTLYGFGQLIDNSDIIVNLLSQPAQQIEQENAKKKIKDSSIEDDE